MAVRHRRGRASRKMTRSLVGIPVPQDQDSALTTDVLQICAAAPGSGTGPFFRWLVGLAYPLLNFRG
jgi:hypothetical protein